MPYLKAFDGARRYSSVNRRRQLRENSLNSTPTFFRKSCDNLSLMMSSESGSLMTAVSRSVLFDALLAEEHDADETDRITFRAFCDWIRDGCPLTLSQIHGTDDWDHPLGSSKSDSIEELNYTVRSNASRLVSETESDPDQVTSTQPTDFSSRHRSTPVFDQFMHYLLEFDVKPCLLFHDTKLRRALYRALPEQNLELIPITRFTELSQTKGSREYGKYCPLLPPLEPTYQLTIDDTSGYKKDKDENRTLVVKISSEARNRIASVISLFQYLKMISREVHSKDLKTSKFPDTDRDDPLLHIDHTVMEKQFSKVQRLRLGMAFARLGFGIPETE
ncbi:unnamed protein product [Echinostoma caproni]|uniref:PI3K/PI4K domain-containing protein n=1 Tax=Echinostoma caproni TaxID=27848 RepID=A0A183AM36_9TREM|nr:unnamed protein product [Echinostoma caproni]